MVEPNAAPDGRVRCPWPTDDPEYLRYHDEEWGVPVSDEVRLFEKLCLEGFQAGLSWITILRKRPNFRAAFAGFDPVRVAAFGDDDVARLMGDAGIVRNRAKIEATINNARALLRLHGEGRTLAGFLWSFEPPPVPPPRTLAEYPSQTSTSKAISKALKKAGFRFVGPTTVYAGMQAMGMVNDHVDGCFRRAECDALRAAFPRPRA
jgi:DNA-3-methyladenine glycosylase I